MVAIVGLLATDGVLVSDLHVVRYGLARPIALTSAELVQPQSDCESL
jgi:hypothetical protein